MEYTYGTQQDILNEQDLSFLKELVETPSTSGHEWPVAHILAKRLQTCADEITTDNLGSFYACLKGKKPGLTVLLDAHIDELGLMIHHIDDRGFCRFKAVGGIDPNILPGLRVNVYGTASGKRVCLRAVIGRKPIHLQEAEERSKGVKFSDLFLDLGLPADEVRKLVEIGDIATYGVNFELYGKNMAVSRGFDDKMGAWIATRVLENIKHAGGRDGDTIFTGTCMEEVGLRGATACAERIDADVSIILEVGHATDYPTVDVAQYGSFKCGGGPMIDKGPNINPIACNRLQAAARKLGISYQLQAQPRATGTNANITQVQKGGKIVAILRVPLRYMHTSTEVLHLQDMQECVDILTEFCLELTHEVNFAPSYELFDNPHALTCAPLQ